MNNQENHLETLSEIRSIMERSTKFISLSGLSGIFSGIFAILGAIPALIYFGYGIKAQNVYQYSRTADDLVNYPFFILFFGDALLILTLAISTAIFLTIRNARKNGQPYYDASAKRLLINLFIPLAAGGIFCIILMLHGHFGMVAPATLLFYGLALFNAGKYTLNDIRYLGLCEIILGLISSYYVGYGILFWIAGFGVLHIIYGTVMYFKYER